MKPVVDPAAWLPEDFARTESWRYVLSDAGIEEIDAAVIAVENRALTAESLTRKDFPLPTVGALIDALREELQNGFGVAQLRGMPIDRWTQAQTAIAFRGIGAHLGRAVPQNGRGDLLYFVKDVGGDASGNMMRLHLTNRRLALHADHCDYNVLFCLRQAKSGGASWVASSVTAYNEMLNQCADLVPELIEPSHWTPHGKFLPDMKPWYDLPVVNFHDGYFSSKGVSLNVMKSQNVPSVPKYSAKRLEAFGRFCDIAQQVAVEIDFQPGDINIFHNHVVLHARDPFEDWPEPDRKRLLYRLWINEEASPRPLPALYRENIQGIRVRAATETAAVDRIDAVT